MYSGLIIVDLDGTLLQPDFAVAAQDIAAMKKAHDLGYLLAICSGRSAHFVKRKLADWQIDEYVTVVIGFNGTEYYDRNNSEEVEALGFITNAEVKEVLNIITEHGIDYSMTWYSPTDIYTCGNYPRLDRLSSQMGIPITYFDKDKVAEAFPDKWPKTVFFFGEHTKEEVKELIEQNKMGSYDLVFSHKQITEMIPHDINKGTALLKVAETYDIAKEDIMAIGDEDNDKGMLLNSGFAMAMGNGVAELKAIADYVTGNLEETGFAQAVEVFLNRKQENNILGGRNE